MKLNKGLFWPNPWRQRWTRYDIGNSDKAKNSILIQNLFATE